MWRTSRPCTAIWWKGRSNETDEVFVGGFQMLERWGRRCNGLGTSREHQFWTWFELGT